jgi:hypothetical protein
MVLRSATVTKATPNNAGKITVTTSSNEKIKLFIFYYKDI